MKKYRPRSLTLFLLLLITATVGMLFRFAYGSQSAPPPPAQPEAHEYYTIIDEADGHTLMYIPVTAQIGDEVLAEDNKLYRITRLQDHTAYASFVQDVNLAPYKK